MTDWVITIMERLGSVGAGLAVLVESIFPPIPSELVLPLAGFTASRGDLNLAAVIVWTTVGSLVGALALYGLGAWLGPKRLRRIAEKVPLAKPEDLDKTEAWFGKHGSKAVFLGRMVPVFRSLISIPAGVTRMPLVRFCLLTTGGSAVWNAALVLAGFLLGEQWGQVERYVGLLQTAVVVGLAAWLAVVIVKRVRSSRPAA